MDARLHAHSPARLIPSVRTLALLTLGVCLGIAAEMPIAGVTLAAVLAVLAAAAAAALIVLRPDRPAAVVGADVLLGVAVVATVFGHLGLLYVPLFVAFLVLTARLERAPEQSEEPLHWEPAPEFEGTMPPSVAAPVVVEHEVVEVAPASDERPAPVVVRVSEPIIVLETDPFADPRPNPEDLPRSEAEFFSPPEPERSRRARRFSRRAEPEVDTQADPESVLDSPSKPDGPRHQGRHRAPSPARRAAAAAARTGRRIGEQARTGASNIRAALTPAEQDGTAVPGLIEPPIEDAEPPGDPSRMRPFVAAPDSGLEDLRHEFEERELEMVAAGKPWSSLTHRAYGELRYLPPPPPKPPTPPRRHPEPSIEIDDAAWETPTWKTIGDP